MNVPLTIAGSLAILGAAVHGVGGEGLVVGKLSEEMLPTSRFGGPRSTKQMIHATWHVTTVAFLAVGLALILSGTALHGGAARGIRLFAAAEATGFAAVVVGVAAVSARSPRLLLRHPGPAVLTATAVLAWWGAL